MKVKRVKNCLFQNAVIMLISKCCHYAYKMLSLCKKYFLAIKYLHTYVQCLYIVYVKHQMSAAKALVQVEFPVFMHYLSSNTKSL